MHESRMDRNWRVVMMVAKSRAPNSRMVYRMHSWPHVDAAKEQGRRQIARYARARTPPAHVHLLCATHFAFDRVTGGARSNSR